MRRGLAGSSSLVLSLLGLLMAGVVAAQAPPGSPGTPAPQIAFEESAVVASGLTPGKTVVWFGVEHRIDADFSGEMSQHYSVGTAAADGTARLALAQPAAPRSFWVAVDLDSGGFAVSSPAGHRLAKPERPPSLLTEKTAFADEILDTRPYLMGLMVRPRVGAWAFAGGDGGPRDLDGVNDGHLAFALDKLDPLPGSPAAPSKAQDKDLWFIVDPLTLQTSVLVSGVAQ